MNVTALSPSDAESPAKLMTAEEFVNTYDNHRVELVRGRVVELPMPFLKHGFVCGEAAFFLNSHVKAHDLGRVMTNDSWVKTCESPDSVRGADVLFYSYERLPKETEIPDKYAAVAPELVFEVRSPTDRWGDVFAKVVEYLQAGVRVVVVLDPGTATASVYRPDEIQQIFDNGDELTLPDVLPGFAVPVKKFFE